MSWSHLAHPDRWRHKSDRPWHRGLRPVLFSNNATSSLRPSNWKRKDEEDNANGLTSPSNDLGLMVRPGFELTTSRSVDRRSSNWANRAAVKSDWDYDRKKKRFETIY